MICSSVKRLRFILWSSQWARAYFKMDYFNGARSDPADNPILLTLHSTSERADAVINIWTFYQEMTFS
jgi:hypothetical protein